MKKEKKVIVTLMILAVVCLTACKDSNDIPPILASMAEDAAETENTDETASDGTAGIVSGEETEDDDESMTASESETAETLDDADVSGIAGDLETVAQGPVNARESQAETPKQPEPEVTVQETAPVQAEVPVHTHSYAAGITVPSSCEMTGIMTYSCTCGDSYSEPIAAMGHQWTTTTETIHHPSKGRVVRTEKKVTVIQCGCGFTAESDEEFQAHSVASLKAWEGDILECPCGGNYWIGSRTEYVDEWVVTQEEYDEVVARTVCTVCGATQ